MTRLLRFIHFEMLFSLAFSVISMQQFWFDRTLSAFHGFRRAFHYFYRCTLMARLLYFTRFEMHFAGFHSNLH